MIILANDKVIYHDDRNAGLGLRSPNASATIMWQRTWGANNTDIDDAYAIALDSQKDVYVVGDSPHLGSTGTSAIIIIKYDPNGKELWERSWDGPAADYASGMALDSAGNIYVSGYTKSYGNGGYDALLVKYNKDGSYIWNKTWGTTLNEQANGIAIGTDDSIYLGGQQLVSGSNYDVIILKYDMNGNRLWNKTWGNASQEIAYGVAVDSSGNLYAAGSCEYLPGAHDSSLLVKFDTNGNYIWNRTWGISTGYRYGRSICIHSLDEIYVVGDWSNVQTLFIIKYNSSGSLTWSRTYSGTYPEAHGVTCDAQGSVYLIGLNDIYYLVLKYNSTGTNIGTNTFSSGSGFDIGYGICVDSQAYTYMTGVSGTSNVNIWTLKVATKFALGTNAGQPDVDGTFDLYWEPSPQADNYSIYEYNHPITVINGSVTRIAQGIVGTIKTLTGNTNGSYYYVALAINRSTSIMSNCISVVVSLFPPDHFILSSDAGNPDDDGYFNLTWSASTYTDNYSIYTSNRFITQINATSTLLGTGNTNQSFPIKRLTNGTYYYIIRAINKFGNRLSNCLKINVLHDIIWEKAVPLGQELNDITRDAAGNLYVTGTSYLTVYQTQLFVAKLNSTGGVIWSHVYGANYGKGFGIAVDSSGNVFVCGEYMGDLLLVKYNNAGAYQWNRVRGGPPYDEAHRVAIDSSGNVIVAGTTSSYGGGNEDGIVLKYDTNGNLQWQQTWGKAGDDFCYGLVLDTSDNIFIAGTTNSTGAGQDDIYVAKFNSAGNQQWNITWGTSGQEGNPSVPLGITLDASGNIYVASCISTFSEQIQGYVYSTSVIKFNAARVQQWNTTTNFAEYDDYACDIIVDRFGNIYITGQLGNAILSQYNQSGACLYNNTWANEEHIFQAMAYDPAGYLYLARYELAYTRAPTIVKVALKPENFTLTTDAGSPDTNGVFDLTWSSSYFAKNYSIYRYSSRITAINGSCTLIAAGLTSMNRSLTNYATGTYYFVIVSRNEYGTWMSNCIRVNVLLSPPGSFTLSANGGNPDIDGAFNLSWTAAFEADNYSLYRYNQPITVINGSLTLIAVNLVNQSYHVANLPTATYYFMAVAINKFGTRLSNCLQKAVLLGPPGTFTLSSNAGFPDGDGKFTLSWTVAEGAKNYTVYYSTSSITSIGPSTIPVVTSITGTSYYIDGMGSGLNNYFAVVAYNNYGNRLSNSIWIYISTSNPSKPGFFKVTTDATSPDIDGIFNFNWTAASGATSYSIYRNTYFFNNIDANSTLVISGNTNRTYHFSGYGAGTYYFVVVAFNAAGNRTSACLQVWVQFGPPSTFTLSSDAGSPDIDGRFTLSWTAAAGALTYSTYNYTSFITSINGSVHLMASGVTALSYPISGLVNGTYYYMIVAFNSQGNRSSNCLVITVTHSRPGAFNLSSDAGSPDTDGTFTLSWTPATNAINYTIYTYPTFISTINGSLTVVATGLAGLSRSVTITANGTYYYIVVAFNTNGNRVSNCISVVIALPPPGHFTLTTDAGTPDLDGIFYLNWTVASGASNYSIYSCNSFITRINGSVILIGSGIVSLGRSVKILVNGTYYYIIVAFNVHGNRSSNCLAVTVLLLPPGPFTLSSDAGNPDDDGRFTLSWIASNGAQYYNVYTCPSPITKINGSVLPVATGITVLDRIVYGVMNGTDYYAVVAFNTNGNRTSNCIAVIVEIHLPGAFTLTSTAGNPDTDGKFALNWTISSYADNYSLYYSTRYITDLNNTVYFIMGGLTNHSIFISSVPSGMHYFAIVATNKIGNTTSNCILVTVQLATPGSFTLNSDATNPDTDGNFTLSWTVSTRANNYSIYVYSRPITSINASLQLIATGITNQTVVLNGFASGTYYFIVVASNNFGNTISNFIEITVQISSGGSSVNPIVKFLEDYWLFILVIAGGIVVISAISASRRKKSTRVSKKQKQLPAKKTMQKSAGEFKPEPTLEQATAPGTAATASGSYGAAGVPQPVISTPVTAKFYCPSCAQYHDVVNPAMQTWYSCPNCGGMLQFIKICPYCNQSIALTKEQYDYYKTQPIQCWNCKNNVIVDVD